MSNLSIVPKRTADPAIALELLHQDGAVIFVAPELTFEGTKDAVRAVLGHDLPAMGEPVLIVAEGNNDKSLPTTDISYGHTDGFSYGYDTPDMIMLHCIIQSTGGGASFILDGYRLLEQMDNDPKMADLSNFLRTVEIDQSDPGMRSDFSRAVRMTDKGRVCIRHHRYQRAVEESPDYEYQKAMLGRWRKSVIKASQEVDRFMLQPGDALFIDNYRVMHGRDPYPGDARRLHRIWMWSKDSFSVPEGMLGSDSGTSTVKYAGAIASEKY
jgi:gamma-butyrobetaine dioxygenase